MLLWVYLNSLFTWDTHVQHMVNRAKRCMFIVIRARRFGFCTKTMQTLYQWYIRTGLDYAAPVWHSSLTNRDTMRNTGTNPETMLQNHPGTSLHHLRARPQVPQHHHARRETGLRAALRKELAAVAHLTNWLPPTMGEMHGQRRI